MRKEQWRQASGEDRKLLKGLRWVLLHHSARRSPKDRRTLQTLEKANRRIYRAWRLKDEFEHFWRYKARWAAERFLKKWTTAALRSRLEPLRRFVNTVRKHAAGITAFVDTHLTNAAAEGLNRIIRMVKNRASGFKSLDAFADLIYLCVGDLDIPAQIPADSVQCESLNISLCTCYKMSFEKPGYSPKRKSGSATTLTYTTTAFSALIWNTWRRQPQNGKFGIANWKSAM